MSGERAKRSRARIIFGTEEVEPRTQRLAAGRLCADLADGALRHIRYDGVEILRGIAFLVRDEDWGTYQPAVTDIRVIEGPQKFSVIYRANCTSPVGAKLSWAAVIEGSADGSLKFSVEAASDTDFMTNRLGFCVLHPIDGVAGAPVRINHGDGSVEQTRFPDLIDPWRPFQHIAAITHEPAPGVTAVCRFEGDDFEMEDQRNWSDASFKTYVRSLDLAWPYVVRAGCTMRQVVSLSVTSHRAAPGRAISRDTVEIEIGEAEVAMPKIGLVISPDQTDATIAAARDLRDLGPQSLLLHFDPAAGHDQTTIEAFARLSSLFPAELTLECILSCQRPVEAELRELARWVQDAGLNLTAITVCPSVDRQSTPPGGVWPACPPFDLIYQTARQTFPHLRLGGGMASYFTELNRKHPPVDLLDYVTHATCPIVHAADDLSVMETLEALPHIVRSARAIIGADKGYRLGPSTIGMRQNPYGSRTADNPDRRRVAMARDDPRQEGLFAASWMVGYGARILEGRLGHWTIGALTGPFGLIGGAGRRPAFHTARDLALLAGQPTFGCRSSAPNRVLGLAGNMSDGRPMILAANLTGEALEIAFRGAHSLHGGRWRLAMLDEDVGGTGKHRCSNIEIDARTRLSAYAVARLTPL